MRVEFSKVPFTQGDQVRLLLVAESSEDSKALDEVFGEEVGDDGLIGMREAVCKLGDQFSTHYVEIKSE